LLYGDFGVSFIPSGYGQNISLMLQPKKGIEIDFSKSATDSPIIFEQAGELNVGEGLAAKVDISFNPSGKFEVKPGFGFGKGEIVSFGPTIGIYHYDLISKDED